MNIALWSEKVLELSILKLAGLEMVRLFLIKAVARYCPSALIAVATAVMRQAPLLLDVVLKGVTFQAIPSNELISIRALVAGLTWP